MPPAPSAPDTTGIAAALEAATGPDVLRALDRLRFRVRQAPGTRPGNTPMPRGAQGSGLEPEGHKAYAPGDDLRHVDWNAYGRLDEVVIRTFRAEREAPLHVFLDISASMAVPASDGKVACAAALAASLAYVSVSSHDPARLVALGGALPGGMLASPFVRHRAGVERLRAFLLALRPGGGTRLADGIPAAIRGRGGGVAVVISDFLVPAAEYEAALGSLAGAGFTVAAVRLLGPAEREPATRPEPVELEDAETGARRRVTLSPAALARYRVALEAHAAALGAFCRRCGIGLVPADPQAGVRGILFETLPSLGLLR